MSATPNLKIAIVGSGASAFGALSGLEASGVTAETTVFSTDRYLDFEPRARRDSADLARFYAGLYAEIRSGAQSFPPRKTFFGDPVPCYAVEGEPRIFRTDMFGGQTNLWAGTVLPLARADFAGWPIAREDLEPHYEAVARRIGIAGRRDALAAFLGLDYSNAPPLKQLAGFAFLGRHLAERAETDDFRIHAGLAPSAVDTRPASPTGCVHCGECMAGCARDAVHSARSALRGEIERGALRFVGRNVATVEAGQGGVAVCCEDGRVERFDRVFLCAGCVGTSEILMRSLGLREGPVLQDNCIYQFPLLNLSRHGDPRKHEYFGLTNLILLFEPKHPELPLLQVQLYPNVDYLWRTLLPRWAWGVARHPVRWTRDRVIWARAYMDAADSYHYALRLENDRLSFHPEGQPNEAPVARCRASLRQALRGSRCALPPVRPVRAHTSAHLAGTFPYGGGATPVARDGEVMPGVHIADSSCFPRSPVISPTLTIMANARRTALEALLR